MAIRKSQEQWMDIIQSCRKSGLTDHQWCEQNDIPISTFYRYVKIFRDHACAIPSATNSCSIPVVQEVVRVSVNEAADFYQEQNTPLSDLPAISLHISGIRMDVNNHADADLLTKTLQVLKNIC